MLNRVCVSILLSALIYCQGAQLLLAKPNAEVFLAPGWGKLSFEAPQAGSYELPVIGPAAGGELLDINGDLVDLDDLLGDRIAILSFIYRTCDDVNGCPLSTMVSHRVASQIKEQPKLHDKIRLLTVSFDPEFDTPEAMKEFGEGVRASSKGEKGEADWRFLTSSSDQAIKPILDAYQQSVVADQSIDGERRKFSHILRVYLIDRQKQIRNIYNVSFLHPDILINDVLTLLMEEELKEKQSAN